MTLDLSALADIVGGMTTGTLLSDIEEFLGKTGMGPSYFGKLAVGNSEIVARLRSGGRVWPETEVAIRDFMDRRREEKAA